MTLTAVGRAEARSQRQPLQHLLAGETPLVIVSPRRRTTETADLALPGCARATEPLLREYDFMDDEGLTSDEIETRAPGWDIWVDGESADAVAARADRFRQKICSADGPVVAVTHGHMSRILAVRAAGLAVRCGRASDRPLATVDGRGTSRPSRAEFLELRPLACDDVSLDAARRAGLVLARRVLDSTPLYDAVATQDTVTMIRSTIRRLLTVADTGLETLLRGVLRRDDDYLTAGSRCGMTRSHVSSW